MRHRNKVNHLSRDTQHRKALLRNLAISLIEEKHITTTTAKAKALRRYVEPLITRSKDDSTHNRRIVFSLLRDKKSINTLFGEVAEKIAARPGGYTRIIKMAARAGDIKHNRTFQIEVRNIEHATGRTFATGQESGAYDK